jgi:hypothetical protein
MKIRDGRPPFDLFTETERTVSQGRLCATCGVTLTDRRPQARFCSDACRMRFRRQKQATRLNELLTTIEKSTAALRGELEVSE